MKVSFEQTGKVTVARVAGELDMLAAEAFRTQLDAVLEQELTRNLVLNFKEVDFIDSSGLGVLLGRYKKLSQAEGKMAIVAPQPQVKRILELSGIMRIMNIYPSEAEAIKKL